MARFFINRPIVAMVISILMTIVGVVAMVQLPIAQFPNIAPPEIQLQATYAGADALTRRAVGRHADRAADERRRQHDLHVLGQRRQRQMTLRVELRRRHRTRTPTRSWRRCATRRRESQLPARRAATTASRSRSRPPPADAVLALLAERNLRRACSSPTTPTSTSTIR